MKSIQLKKTRQYVFQKYGKVYPLLLALLLIGATLSGYATDVKSSEAAPGAPSNLTVTTKNSIALELNWTDNSTDETGFRIERSYSADTLFKSIAILTANSTYFLDPGLKADTTYHYRVSAINGDGESAYSNVASAKTDTIENDLPYYWAQSQTGNPPRKGSASFENGHLFVEGNGFINNRLDDSFIIYQEMHGDGEIVGQVNFTLKEPWQFTGLIIRENLEDSSRFVINRYHRNTDTVTFVTRSENSPVISYNTGTPIEFNHPPIWMKLQRQGDTFIASISENGITWIETHRQTFTMPENTFAGIVNYSNNDSKYSKTTYREVAVSQDDITPPSNLASIASPFDEITLTWADNAADETGYRIERALKGDTSIFVDIAEVGANTTSFTDDGLNPGSFYFYRVRAIKNGSSSLPSNEVVQQVIKIPNTILFMPRLTGDHDKTSNNNTITVTTTADTALNELRHPGLIGKQIDITLNGNFSSTNGSLSLKLMPNTHHQTVDFFKSDGLTISQKQNQLSINANGIETNYDVFLDTLTCNHLVLKMNNGVMTPYINGAFFAGVDVGTFSMNSLTLGQFNGKLWDIHIIDDQITDDAIYELGERCTNSIALSGPPPFADFPNRICGVYTCNWVANGEDITAEKHRAYLTGQDIAYDRNTFDITMYPHPDLEDHVLNKERNIPSIRFNDLTFPDLFPRGSGKAAYWLHENFHGYQGNIVSNSKWLAESTANWAAWSLYKESQGRGVDAFTLFPHLSLLDEPGLENLPFAKAYASYIFWAYLTTFVSDESFIGKIYNTEVAGHDPIAALTIRLADEGHIFNDVFAEFAARTVVWDYPDRSISDDFAALETEGIRLRGDNFRFVSEFGEEGTYGIMHPAPKEFRPGPYAWNTYKVDSTAAATYTISLSGSDINLAGTEFRGIIITGTPGSYIYHNLPISTEIALGTGSNQIEVTTEAGEELYLVVVTTCTAFSRLNEPKIAYSYGIESSEHPLPNDHIKTFILEEQTGQSNINHDNHTVDIEVAQGTEPGTLNPIFTLSEGATSSPESGEEVDFTEPVIYKVSGEGNESPTDWKVTVHVVPGKTGTDFITFVLDSIAPFARIDKKNHAIIINLDTVVDLTNAVPVFTLSEGATSEPVSGQIVDLTSPVEYTITAEDGTKQTWTVSTADFRPFITSWITTKKDETIELNMSRKYVNDFSYIWKNSDGNIVASGSEYREQGGTFSTKLRNADTYTLEITGAYPVFNGLPMDKFINVEQWGDVPIISMPGSFGAWPGVSFNATDIPNTSQLEAMSKTFINASNFNGDLSQWDVSNVKDMEATFQRATAFNGDLSEWDVSNVVTMTSTFKEARSFNSDISKWDISNVKDATQMLSSTDSFNADIRHWNPESMLVMDEILQGARSFNWSLGDWDITNIISMEGALNRTNLSKANYDRTLIGWASQDVKTKVTFGAEDLEYCSGESARNQLISKGWVITDKGINCPEVSEANILSFILEDQFSAAVIDDINHTISIEAKRTADITKLTANLALSKDATSTPASGDTLDFTNPVVYTVTSSDGATIIDWIVTVTKLPNNEAKILGLEIADQKGPTKFSHKDRLVYLQAIYGTDLTAITPILTLSSGATSSLPANEVLNFTDTVSITITAEDGMNSQIWKLVITEALNEEADIKSFELAQQNNPSVISSEENSISIEVIKGADMTKLIPEFTISEGASSSPAIGSEMDLTNPMVITVTAEDTTVTQEWTVTAIIISNEAELIDFELDGQVTPAIIDSENQAISVIVAHNADITKLKPTFTISDKATSSPASGEVLDFTNLVAFTITAEDKKTVKEWVIDVIQEDPPLSSDLESLLEVYPNPVNDHLQINSKNVVSVELTDMAGRTVIEQQSGNSITLDLTGLSSGTYFLNVTSQEETETRKIIKIDK